MAIFRRFGTLSALNLMRLQAELIEIEELLRAKQLRDDGAEKPEQDFSTSLFKLNLERATKEGDKGHPNQMALMELAQQKLISYRMCPRIIISV